MTLDYKHIDFEVKADESEEGRIIGYGAVYGTKDQGRDIIVKGAFDKSLASRPRPKMLWQHDPYNVIGVWDKVTSDEKGLKVEGQLLLDIPQARTAHTLAKAGALDGLSIGYKTIDHEFTGRGEEKTRTLKELELWEVSVVTFPMNTEATLTDVKRLQNPREVEYLLRKAGVPSTCAKLIALYGFEEAMERLTDRKDGHRKGADAEKGVALIEKLRKRKELFNA